MSVLETAKVLAEQIATSSEINEVRAAEVAMNEDAAAMEIIREFQTKQVELQDAYAQGQELSDAQKATIEALESKMNGNASISRYIEAQNKLEQMLQSVSFIIQQAISGESSCNDGDCSCDGGCNCGC